MSLVNEPKPGSKSSGQVQSLTRALILLDDLSKTVDGYNLSELARKASLPRSTTHRLLTTMEAQRFVRFNRKTNKWSIGVQAFAVGSAFALSRNYGEAARTTIRQLMKELHETITVSICDGDRVRYIEQAVHPSAERTFAFPGASVPLYASAAGKGILAFSHDEDLKSYLKEEEFRGFTSRTIVNRRDLVEDLGRIRKRGFAIDDEERKRAVRCIAAPIFDEKGLPVAALSISGAAQRMTKERFSVLGTRLQKAAERVTADIGGMVPH